MVPAYLQPHLTGIKTDGNWKRALTLEKFKNSPNYRHNRELLGEEVVLDSFLINFASKVLDHNFDIRGVIKIVGNLRIILYFEHRGARVSIGAVLVCPCICHPPLESFRKP